MRTIKHKKHPIIMNATNGTNFDGADVSTGVYLFLCTSADFETSIVKKVLIYN